MVQPPVVPSARAESDADHESVTYARSVAYTFTVAHVSPFTVGDAEPLTISYTDSDPDSLPYSYTAA
jgi:hypothetical protein